jgi:hypothetical protein
MSRNIVKWCLTAVLVICMYLFMVLSMSFAIDVPGWFGEENQGGGIAITDVNKNDKPDLIVFHIDNPDGGNKGYYRVGFDLDESTNVAKHWSDPLPVESWFGDENAAGDIAVANINNNNDPDLVIFSIDNPDGGNAGYYRVGWDLNKNGQVTKWDKYLAQPLRIPGWFGDESDGGGIALADLNNNKRPDLIVFHVDDRETSGPFGYGFDSNHGYYRIGWDLNEYGEATWGKTDPTEVGGWFGFDSQGGDIAATDIDKNGMMDLIVYHIDNPDGANTGWYRVGWDLNPNTGDVTKWDDPMRINGNFGDQSFGAGIDVLRQYENGANFLYFSLCRVLPSFGVGVIGSGLSEYDDLLICWGGQCRQAMSTSTVSSSNAFISEPVVTTITGTAIIPETPASIPLEENTDRPGMNYKQYTISSPDLCANDCANDPNCKAFTYVKPGARGPNSAPECWLKNGVPNAVSGECCVSGVK